MLVHYRAGGFILVGGSTSDIHTLPSVPATVWVPGEDALPTALIVCAVSDWDLHKLRASGNIQQTLWKGENSRRLFCEQVTLLKDVLISIHSFLPDPDVDNLHRF